ncbi:MAG: metal ABC transporter substrate-binding protein, partial [Gammaproteobacteria bacterium]|nr:metal ABC transporter substrate-binding protein [Gammaproteobacteria bacterium]
ISIDPHIWLSIRNATAICKHIFQQLVASDPENTARYQANLRRLTDRMTQLSRKIDAELNNNRQPFITYHDAYQYFEDEHQLNHIDSISFDEEAGISLKHLHHITDSIEKNDVRCLLYQSPKPDIVDSLTKKSQLAAFALDPLGLDLDDENEAWFQIMLSTAATFKQCLAH